MDHATVKKAVIQAFEIATVIGQCIKELGTVPAGQLYANLGSTISLPTFNGAVDVLVKSGLVRRDANHLLTWIGDTPKKRDGVEDVEWEVEPEPQFDTHEERRGER
jgi:hypothetical protein